MITSKFRKIYYEDKAVNTESIDVANQVSDTQLEISRGEIGGEERGNRTGREDEVGDLVQNGQSVEEDIMRITQDLPIVLAQYEDQLN